MTPIQRSRPVQAGRLLSVRDFAVAMGCSVSQARKLCYSRRVASVKYSRSLMVPASEVERLIAEHLIPALAERQ